MEKNRKGHKRRGRKIYEGGVQEIRERTQNETDQNPHPELKENMHKRKATCIPRKG